MSHRPQTHSWAAFLLYDLLLWAAGVLLLPFVLWRLLRSASFRRTLPARFGFVPYFAPAKGRILLHGVSVGEVKALRSLVRELRERFPAREVVIASSTPTGLAAARAAYPDLQVVAYPLDLPGAGRRFLKRVKPSLVVLAELEIWPNFLLSCTRLGIQVAIVNGRITERSMAGYRRVQRWLPQFDRIALYGVQNERYAERFHMLSVPSERIVVTGNLKYDNLPTLAEDQAFRDSVWPRWQEGVPLVVLASTHEPEEVQVVREWMAKPVSAQAVLVVVPRHPRRSASLMQSLRKECGAREVALLSRIRERPRLEAGSVLLVDGFGELEAIYRCVRAAFLGGSLISHGGQNMLEASAVGVPVVVGPHTENFLEEVEKLRHGGGLVVVEDASQVVECLLRWLEDPQSAKACGQLGAKTLETERGAAQSTIHALQQAGLLSSSG